MIVRHRFQVRGVVQGVGFRPYVYALARDLGLAGTVHNDPTGVLIEVEGPASAVHRFGDRLPSEAPPLAMIVEVGSATIPRRGGTEFVIADSAGGAGRTLVSPDVATCAECLAELADPSNRRYRHAFISCTNCGPRFTVIEGLPYDRAATTMRDLPLCAACASEYADPADRRFHAQTIACPDCGPRLTLRRPGRADGRATDALAEARRLIADGAVVAVKGLGGYHLACDATDRAAVATLRKRKDRGDKPFAVMVADLAGAERLAVLSDADRALLTDHRRPVVLLPRRGTPAQLLAREVAPDSPDLGLFLPYTPVHRLLFGLPGDPAGPQALVMTSGNLAGEPIVTDDDDALERLATLADAWLTNDRPIRVPCDDSVLRIVGRDQLPVRRSRGYAPLPIALPAPVRPALAVGGDLKNTFAVGADGLAWLSAHVGDMDDLATLRAFETATAHLSSLTGVVPELIVADAHPGYRSTRWARRQSALPVYTVQHHHAHIAAALAENGHPGHTRVIGVAFDGTGYGTDATIWGGELLLADYAGFDRAGHLAHLQLPGGDAGVRNPCRMALSALHASNLDWDRRLPSVAACGEVELSVVARQLATGLGCAPTSSMGRLFDAVSSLAGVCHRVAYEAEAAMRFEALARQALPSERAGYAFAVDPDTLIADPRPVLSRVVADVSAGRGADVIAARFHRGVAALVSSWAQLVRERTGLAEVALSGGVFLNVALTQLCDEQLSTRHFRVLRHRTVPPSDAGLALGQLAVGARRAAELDADQARSDRTSHTETSHTETSHTEPSHTKTGHAEEGSS